MKNVILVGDNTSIIRAIKKNKYVNIVESRKYKFSNENILYRIGDLNSLDKINILADLSKNLHENLWNLFSIIDLLDEKRIVIDKLIFPYLPYSRSNNKYKNMTFPLFTLIRYLNQYKIRQIFTFDPHFGNQNLPFKSEFKKWNQVDIFKDYLDKYINNRTVVVGPDKGSKERIDILKNRYNISGGVFEKHRNNHKEKVEVSIKQEKVVQYINNSNHCCILDDEICSGSTIEKTINEIKKIKRKVKIDIFITHFFMENINNNLMQNIHNLYTTNSIDHKLQTDKIHIIDLSDIIKREINA